MSTRERKERERDRRRNQIIDAAEKVIFDKGIDQATMKEVAQEADLSKGTLYIYFKNKSELYVAIAQRGTDILNNRFAQVFAGDQTGIEIIYLIGQTYLDFVRNNPDYFKAFMYYETLSDIEELENSTYAQSCETKRRQSINYIIRALQIGMQDGTIDDSYNPKELAIVIWSSTRGITTINHIKKVGYHFQMLDEMKISVDSLFESFLKLVGTGIVAGKARDQWMTGSHKFQESEG